MPPGERKRALTRRVDEAMGREDRVKALLEEAREPYREGQLAAKAGDERSARAAYALAVERLRRARALTRCEKRTPVLDQNIAKVQTRLEGLGAR